jgi:hypothetical protein
MIFYPNNFDPDVPLNFARIGYDNLVRNAAISATSRIDGFPPSAVANPLTYEYWRPQNGSGSIVMGFPLSPVDYVGIASHNLKNSPVKIELSTDATNYVEVMTVTPTSDAPIMVLFDEVQAAFLRVTVNAPEASVGIIYAGKALAMQRRIWGGVNPLNLSRRTVIRPNISENGQWLGRSIIREGSATSVTFRNLSYDWYRANFDPFVESARKYPFFFGMRPDEYPEITGYVWTNNDIVPQTSGIRNFLDVSVDMQGLAIE